ncbi:STAS domain-containing protein [Pseudonocardia humida]|uniref:STAS domain-containing protein n=1 Tax=Pseudonocardia humida TaxID=2800819 RepID=A0ABT0ZWC8_9PSEU|nr:STAS domain-containing protein [Pseudonocardia humida]MCO1655035.1 STAS domain-containing protein [Pseudonocardia humida]
MLIVALCRPADDSVVVEVGGELDAFNCGLLAETLGQAVARGTGAVIVDLARVDYFSAAGLHCLDQAAEQAAAAARPMHLVCAADGAVLRVLRAAGMSARWSVHPDVEQARLACAAAAFG